MHAVESGSHAAFLNILKETGNTVCGRHPIGVVMAAVEVLRAAGGVGGGVGGGAEGIEGGKGKVEGEGTGGGEEQGEGEGKEGEGKGERWGKFKFVRYERSSLVKAVRDSSVSYASAFAVL